MRADYMATIDIWHTGGTTGTGVVAVAVTPAAVVVVVVVFAVVVMAAVVVVVMAAVVVMAGGGVFDRITTEMAVGVATIRWPVIVTAVDKTAGLVLSCPNVVDVVLSLNWMLTYGARSTTVAVHMYVNPFSRLKFMPSVLVIAVPLTTGEMLNTGLT